MTELINRPEAPIDPDELQAMFDAESPVAEQTNESAVDTREVSPTGSSIVRAATRINSVLERRAINKAHSEALKEYRSIDNAGYVDHIASLAESEEVSPMAQASAQMALEREHRIADTKEFFDTSKENVSKLGRSALKSLKSAGMITLGLGVLGAEAAGRGAKRTAEMTGDGMMAGFAKAEAGMDRVGNKILETKADIKSSYQTYQFNRETKANQKQFQKEYAKEVKAFDKATAKEAKIQAKQDKIDIKEAAREDRRFERSMHKKAALERRNARRARWSASFDTLKATAVSGIESSKDFVTDTTDKARETAERAKQKARITRTAGRMALATYRDTKEAFRS